MYDNRRRCTIVYVSDFLNPRWIRRILFSNSKTWIIFKPVVVLSSLPLVFSLQMAVNACGELSPLKAIPCSSIYRMQVSDTLQSVTILFSFQFSQLLVPLRSMEIQSSFEMVILLFRPFYVSYEEISRVFRRRGVSEEIFGRKRAPLFPEATYHKGSWIIPPHIFIHYLEFQAHSIRE